MDSEQISKLKAEAQKHEKAVVDHVIKGDTATAKKHASKLSEIMHIIQTIESAAAPIVGTLVPGSAPIFGLAEKLTGDLAGNDAPQPTVNQIQADREKQPELDRIASLEARVDAVEANLNIHNTIHGITAESGVKA